MITSSRLVLALVLFVLLALVSEARGAQAGSALVELRAHERALLNSCGVIFVTAAISDILDGHVARRWGLVTDFGRIVDPFADKVVVCGTFMLLVPLEGSQVAAWMVVLILARELLVDGLRGFAEAKGVAFSALISGKLKMAGQSGCVIWILFGMANLSQTSWFASTTYGVLLVVVAVTLFSTVQYVVRARTVLGGDSLAQHSPPPPAGT